MPGEFRPSLPGERRGGRKKGTPNKVDATIKDMILAALSDVGGRDYLARQALENPGPFLTLIGKVLPLQLTGDPDRPIAVDFRWADATPHAPTIEGEATDAQIEISFESNEG